MAKKKVRRVKLNKGKIDTKIIVGIVALLVGLPLAGGAAVKQTSVRNYASTQANPSITVKNLNQASEITKTINADGTMGPETHTGNYSFKQPSDVKGTLKLALADEKKKEEKAKDKANGPQSITSLKLTVTKVEVHLAYKKGTTREKYKRVTPSKSEDQPKEIRSWETLVIHNPTIVDIIDDSEENPLSTLGLTELCAGKYTEVRLYISAAQATLADGKTVDVFVLPQNKIVRIVKPFTIEEGKATILKLDVDKDHSVIKAGDTYILKPVIAKMEEEH